MLRFVPISPHLLRRPCKAHKYSCLLRSEARPLAGVIQYGRHSIEQHDLCIVLAPGCNFVYGAGQLCAKAWQGAIWHPPFGEDVTFCVLPFVCPCHLILSAFKLLACCNGFVDSMWRVLGCFSYAQELDLLVLGRARQIWQNPQGSSAGFGMTFDCADAIPAFCSSVLD